MKGMGLDDKSVIDKCLGGGACTSTGAVKRVGTDDVLGDGKCIACWLHLHLGRTERSLSEELDSVKSESWLLVSILRSSAQTSQGPASKLQLTLLFSSLKALLL